MRITLFIILTLLMSVNTYSQKSKYKDLLEPKSKLISWEYNLTLEKTKDGKYIYKRYYPENRMITQYVTFANDNYDKKDGLFYRQYDDGTLVERGHYIDNVKVGEWIENSTKGVYKSGVKEGGWKTYNKDSTIRAEYNYIQGEMDGKYIRYDSIGEVSYEEIYQKGTLLSTTRDTVTTSEKEEMPRFYGCKDSGLEGEELKKCSDNKLLAYMYSRLKYPRKAREQGVQGSAIVQFVVEKDGTIEEINVLNGLSKEIKKECLKLVKGMPKWRPGMQAGKPVRVVYTLPIQFKLRE